MFFIFPFLNFSLSGLGLTCIPAELLQRLPNLEEVDLSKNKLTAIVQDGALPQVKVLSFANNQLNNVEGLMAFPNLESLDVTNNPTLEVTRWELIRHQDVLIVFVKCDMGPHYDLYIIYNKLLSLCWFLIWL